MMWMPSSLFDGSSNAGRHILWQLATCLSFCSQSSLHAAPLHGMKGEEVESHCKEPLQQEKVAMVSSANQERSLPFLIALLWDQSVAFVWNSVCASGVTGAETLCVPFAALNSE